METNEKRILGPGALLLFLWSLLEMIQPGEIPGTMTLLNGCTLNEHAIKLSKLTE